MPDLDSFREVLAVEETGQVLLRVAVPDLAHERVGGHPEEVRQHLFEDRRVPREVLWARAHPALRDDRNVMRSSALWMRAARWMPLRSPMMTA